MSVEREAAIAYARRRRPVFPVTRAKKPLTKHSFKDATTDRATIERWWTRWPHAGIATPTGPNWFVLDSDDADALAALEAEHGPLPPTVGVVTPRPGLHLYLFGQATNSDSALPDGLNVRGSGGYVLLPPSSHENGRRYEWRTAPDEAPIAPAPAWLLALLASPANGTGCGEYRPPARPIIEGEGRHNYLADFAVRLVRGGIVDRETIQAHLRFEFERSCAPLPPARRGEFEGLANFAVGTDIAERERRRAELAEFIRRRREERSGG